MCDHLCKWCVLFYYKRVPVYVLLYVYVCVKSYFVCGCVTSVHPSLGHISLFPALTHQVDSRGQNFLHLAVSNQDLEAVIFLLSVCVDINSKVQGQTLNTPLHYAVKSGSEILTRHLVRDDTACSTICCCLSKEIPFVIVGTNLKKQCV